MDKDAWVAAAVMSTDKATLPGRKQVFRIESSGVAERDVLAGRDESLPGRPLLRPVMKGGRRLATSLETLEEIRARAAEEMAKLPARLRALECVEPPYRVELSEALRARADRLRTRIEGRAQ